MEKFDANFSAGIQKMAGALTLLTSVTVIWKRFVRTANASWSQLDTIPSLTGTLRIE